jgi:hypothetical protein
VAVVAVLAGPVVAVAGIGMLVGTVVVAVVAVVTPAVVVVLEVAWVTLASCVAQPSAVANRTIPWTFITSPLRSGSNEP